MKCEYCDNEIPMGGANCPNCGAACKSQMPQQSAGVPVYPNQQPYVQQPIGTPYAQPKSRLVYILLALFLGAFGVHNFYAGRIGSGVAQLLINVFLFWLILPPVIVGIWVLVEIITVTRDARGVPFVA